jgi:hypothetical protein
MRLRGSRRPAGVPRVPEVVPTELPFEGVFVLRLGPGRVLLDLPTGTDARRIASVWLAGDEPTWVRASWPVDVGSVLPIAPLDLWSGHIIEFSGDAGKDWRASYACVLAAQNDALVCTFAASPTEAISTALQIHTAWSRTRVESRAVPA